MKRKPDLRAPPVIENHLFISFLAHLLSSWKYTISVPTKIVAATNTIKMPLWTLQLSRRDDSRLNWFRTTLPLALASGDPHNNKHKTRKELNQS